MELTLRALADPSRRKILRLLREADLTAGMIAERFPMTAPSVSHHLKVLKEANLVRTERDGRYVVYSLNVTVLQEALEEIMGFFRVRGEER